METFIYHFTHKDNIPRILAEGSLYCDSLCVDRKLPSRIIAYQGLKERRSRVAVEVHPYGFLNDYVPFYFGPRSPMMYVYQKGRVTGVPERTDTLVYFVTSAETVRQANLPYVFTDGHPVQRPRFFSNDLDQLGRVDLPLMSAAMWNDTDEDPDRMRRRQAEFLVHQQLSLKFVRFVGVKTSSARAKMNELLRSHGNNLPVYVRPSWYY